MCLTAAHSVEPSQVLGSGQVFRVGSAVFTGALPPPAMDIALPQHRIPQGVANDA